MLDHDLSHLIGVEASESPFANWNPNYPLRRDSRPVHPSVFKKTFPVTPRHRSRLFQSAIEHLPRRIPIVRCKHTRNADQSSRAHRRQQSLSLITRPRDHSRSITATPFTPAAKKC